MEDMLTTRQLMEQLHLDRTTIYRMLNDGRLPGVRVGGQWRFSRSAIETLLQGQNTSAPTQPEAEEKPSPAPRVAVDILPLHCLAPIQEVFAQTAGIGAVTTKLDGEPLTEFSNPCAFCRVILSSDKGRAHCRDSWRALANQPEDAPHLATCHAGLGYARGRIMVQDTFLAMIFSGQFLVGGEGTALTGEQIEQVAEACGVNATELRQSAKSIPVIAAARANQLLGLLQMVANTFSNIGHERLELVRRLKQVAEIAGEVTG